MADWRNISEVFLSVSPPAVRTSRFFLELLSQTIYMEHMEAVRQYTDQLSMVVILQTYPACLILYTGVLVKVELVNIVHEVQIQTSLSGIIWLNHIRFVLNRLVIKQLALLKLELRLDAQLSLRLLEYLSSSLIIIFPLLIFLIARSC